MLYRFKDLAYKVFLMALKHSMNQRPQRGLRNEHVISEFSGEASTTKKGNYEGISVSFQEKDGSGDS